MNHVRLRLPDSLRRRDQTEAAAESPPTCTSGTFQMRSQTQLHLRWKGSVYVHTEQLPRWVGATNKVFLGPHALVTPPFVACPHDFVRLVDG